MVDLSDRRGVIWLIVIVLAAAIAGVGGVASIFPVLAVVADPGRIEQEGLLRDLYLLFGLEDVQSFLIALTGASLLALLISLILKSASILTVHRFVRRQEHLLSLRLLARYLGQPYEWIVTRNTAELGSSLLSEVERVAVRGIGATIDLIVRVAFFLIMLGFLLALDPLVAVVSAGVVGGSYLIVFLVVRRLLSRLGEERRIANSARFRIAGEALGGFKEVKLLGLEHRYVSRFAPPSASYSRTHARLSATAEIPRHIIELIVFGGLLVGLLFVLLDGSTLNEVIPTIGVFAFAGVKLFPELQSIFRAITDLRFIAPAIEMLDAQLRDKAAPGRGVPYRIKPDWLVDAGDPPPQPMALRQGLRLEDIAYRYPASDRTAIDGLSLEIPAWTTVGIIGKTGAGKSTLVDLILGLLTPQSGRLVVDGHGLAPEDLPSWRASVGYVPQHIYLSDDTLAANIAFGTPEDDIDQAAVERAARMADLHEFINSELPEGYRTVVGERGVRLSGGQRQRIGIARALYHDPDVLLLDEATSALDVATEARVMAAIQALQHEKTIILIAHRHSTIEQCDKVFVLASGALVAEGSVAELKAAGHMA